VLVLVLFRSEEKVPAMKTRWPTTSMSQISPVLIRGVLVRGVLGTRPVWPGAGCAAPAGGAATKPRARVARTGAVAATTYFGTLSIDAEPGGDVYIDRRMVGRTPQRVANLRAGSHLVWIERDGYRRYTTVVQVPANRVSRVSVALEPADAR